MDEIVVKYKWTADELVAAHRWHCRHRVRRFFRAMLWVFAVLFMAAGAFGLYNSGELSGLILIVFGVFCVLALTGLDSWYLRWQFKSRPDNGIDIEWRISADHLSSRTPLATTESKWKAYSRVVQSPDGFLFYPIKQLFFWLPRHGFTSDADYDRLAQLAQQNSVQFHTVT